MNGGVVSLKKKVNWPHFFTLKNSLLSMYSVDKHFQHLPSKNYVKASQYEGLVAQLGAGNIKDVYDIPAYLKIVYNLMDNYYPGWQRFQHGGGLIPSCFPVTCKGPRDPEANCLVSVPNEAIVRGDDAELKVFREFEKMINKDVGMFVITNFRVAVLSNVFKLAKKELAKKLGDLEIDFLVFSLTKGIVIGEVKAMDHWKDQPYDKAIDQLNNQENVMNKISSLFAFPYQPTSFRKVVFLPNLPETQIRRASADGQFTKEDFEHFEAVWNEKVPDANNSNVVVEYLNRMTATLVCQHCSLTTPHGMANIGLLLKAQDIMAKKEKKRFKDYKLQRCTTTLYLTPEQFDVWNGPEKQIIFGHWGTGKTELIKHKLLSLCEEKENFDKLFVFVGTEQMVGLYSQFLSAHHHRHQCFRGWDDVWKISSSITQVVVTGFKTAVTEADIAKLLWSINEANGNTRRRKQKWCLLCDDFEFLSSFKDYQILCEQLGHAGVDLKTFWFANQWPSTWYDEPEGTITYNNEVVRITRLTTTMRYTKEIADYLSNAIESFRRSTLLGHGIVGPAIVSKCLFGSQHDVFSKIVDLLDDDIKPFVVRTSEGETDYRRVAVLYDKEKDYDCGPRRYENLRAIFNRRGIAIRRIDGYESLGLVVDYGENAHSYEWDCVYLIEEGWRIQPTVRLSRATVKLVQLHLHLKGYEQDFKYPSDACYHLQGQVVVHDESSVDHRRMVESASEVNEQDKRGMVVQKLFQCLGCCNS